MRLISIIPEYFKMDGGACFGVVPKTIWRSTIPTDQDNLINLASRCILADTGDKLILVDTGMGNKQSDKYFSYYHPFGNFGLESSLKAAGYEPNQVTDVIFTHLHFDHAGGAIRNGKDPETFEAVFPNATHYVTKTQWDWAMDPNPREKASYFLENYLPLFENGQLQFIHKEGEFCHGVTLEIKNGHTRGLLIPIFDYQGRKVVFTTDFIPFAQHLHLPYVAAFDIDPLTAMEEKKEFLNRAYENDWVLCFQHDYYHECCSLLSTQRGIRQDQMFKLSDL